MYPIIRGLRNTSWCDDGKGLDQTQPSTQTRSEHGPKQKEKHGTVFIYQNPALNLLFRMFTRYEFSGDR